MDLMNKQLKLKLISILMMMCVGNAMAMVPGSTDTNVGSAVDTGTAAAMSIDHVYKALTEEKPIRLPKFESYEQKCAKYASIPMEHGYFYTRGDYKSDMQGQMRGLLVGAQTAAEKLISNLVVRFSLSDEAKDTIERRIDDHKSMMTYTQAHQIDVCDCESQGHQFAKLQHHFELMLLMLQDESNQFNLDQVMDCIMADIE